MSKLHKSDQAEYRDSLFVKNDNTKNKSALVKVISKIAKTSSMPKRIKPISRFIDNYLTNVALNDISELSHENLFGLIQAHWKLAEKRQPGETLAHVYNPSLKESGWDCEYTVIEIVNDDMPFLVDSVFSVLNRLELTPHLVLHPIFNVLRSKPGKFEGFSFVSSPSPRPPRRISSKSIP